MSWVIEKANSARHNPEYFSGLRYDSDKTIWAEWSYNKDHAVQFCRKTDADAINRGFAKHWNSLANRICKLAKGETDGLSSSK